VAQKLIDLGYQNISALLGGWTAWQRAGYPTEP